MRWVVDSAPKRNDRRTKRGFLFFPKVIGHQARWLEVASWEEVRDGHHTCGFWWRPIRWL